MAATTALLVSACGGSSSDGSSSGNEGANTPSEKTGEAGFIGFIDRKADQAGEPVDGGTLVFAPFAPARSLDPAASTDSGIGNAELSALYDALVRYDYEAEEYVPWVAESFDSDDAGKVWTIKLREGVNFSDGTPLDSAAVKLHLERSQELRPGSYTDDITVETPDDLTVVYTLPSPWPGFLYALSVNPGRIVSPAAVEEYGDEVSEHPVGVGPFVLDKWTPGEELVAKRNPDYWDGTPHLDGIKFVTIKGDDARADSLIAGDVDAGFVRTADPLKKLMDNDLRGFQNVFPGGEVLIINNGVKSDDVPGADVRVRRAMAMALDIDLMRDDLDGGSGLWTKEILGLTPELDTTVEALPYDADKATALLDEAKADGYDGKVTLTCDATPERERKAISVQAQLNAVGFDVTIDRVPTIADTMKKYQQDGTFELACYGFSVNGNAPIAVLSKLLSPGNTLGYEDPEIEGILDDLQSAKDRAEMSTAADALQTKFNETQPLIPLVSSTELLAWTTNVHGMDMTSFNQPIFAKAWIDG